MTNTMVYKNNQLQGGNPFTMIYNPITTDYNGDYNALQLFTMIDNQLQLTTMAITMIDNQLQSIYNHLHPFTMIYNPLQPTTMAITMIDNQLQSICNHFHPFTMIYNPITTDYNGDYNDLQLFTMIDNYNQLQWRLQ